MGREEGHVEGGAEGEIATMVAHTDRASASESFSRIAPLPAVLKVGAAEEAGGDANSL